MGSNFNISRDFIFYPIHKLNYHMEKIKLIWDFRGPDIVASSTPKKPSILNSKLDRMGSKNNFLPSKTPS